MRNVNRQKVVLSLVFLSSLSLGTAAPNQQWCQPAKAANEQTKTQLPVSKTISLEALKKYEPVSVEVEADGKKINYTGVPLRVMLGEMMPELNLSDMPGWKDLSRLELVMEVLGSDGFPGLVTGTELAINKSGDRFLLATERDGKPNENGIQLICRMDEARTRCVKQVVSLRLVSLAKK